MHTDDVTVQLGAGADARFASRCSAPKPLCVPEPLAAAWLSVDDAYMSAMPEEIRNLSLEDRLRLVEDIWESIRSDAEALPLTPAQRDELEHRLAEHRANPSAGDDLATVLERIRAGR